MRNVLLAPIRCLALVLLTAVGLVMAQVVGVLVALVLTYPYIVAANRALAGLGRRLSQRWCGVSIEAGYRPIPADPIQHQDGWYIHENQLYRRAWFPRYLRRYDAVSHDPAVLRDWLWLAFTPITGGLAVALPLLLLAGAGLLAGRSLVASAGLVVAAFAIAPQMLRLYGRWSRVLLQPQETSWYHRSGLGPWVRQQWRWVWQGGALAAMSVGAFGFGVVNLIAVVTSWYGLAPHTMAMSRPYLEHYRRRVFEWTGRELGSPYRPAPAPPRPDAMGKYRSGRTLHRDLGSATRAARNWAMVKDPASWRDLLWTLTAPLLAPVPLMLMVVAAVAFFGLVWQPLWWTPWGVPIGIFNHVWITPFYMWSGVVYVLPSAAAVPGWVSPFIGAFVAVLVMLLSGPVMRLRLAYDRLLLSPTRAATLAQRVHQLTQTRTDATDAQAAEVRRIERDLHDGAQARLVAVGMSLATVEQLLERDPQAARAMLVQARETSATALTELRDLVRGIHPPVLSERGLGDAVRAVALDYPLPVDVSVDLPGRLDPPIESAAYFAVLEALTNATRHGGATRITVDLRYTDGTLRLTVTDDGRGGADPARGTGLAGIGRRLGTFDGVLSVDSPPGGPTELRMEVPCAFSSPRTSTS